MQLKLPGMEMHPNLTKKFFNGWPIPDLGPKEFMQVHGIEEFCISILDLFFLVVVGCKVIQIYPELLAEAI
jgi:hypothetical protein